MFIEFPIPALIPSFVKLDVSDLPELLAAFSLGPVYGIVVTFLKNLLFSVLHGTSSAYVGELFNFVIRAAVFSFSAGLHLSAFGNHKSRKGALDRRCRRRRADGRGLPVPFNYLLVYPAYVVCYRTASGGHRRDVPGHPPRRGQPHRSA